MAEQLSPNTGFTRPIYDMKMVKFDADTLSGSSSERERMRTIGALGLRTAPDHVFNPQRPVNPMVARLAEERARGLDLRFSREDVSSQCDEVLAGLQTELTAQLGTMEIEEYSGARRLAQEVMLARGDLRFLQEAWRDSLDEEIATRLFEGGQVSFYDSTNLFSDRYDDGVGEVIQDDKRLRRARREYNATTNKPDVSMLKIDRAHQSWQTADQRNKEVKANFKLTQRDRQRENSIGFTSYSWLEIERLVKTFDVKLRPFLRRPNFLLPHYINNPGLLDFTKIPGVRASIWRDIQEGRQNGYDFILEFTPDAQSMIAREPLLPVNYQTR